MWKLCLGGTFDPIHHGHLICARAAAQAVGASGVVLIPAAVAPHKQNDRQVAPAADRMKMCELAIAGAPGFEVDGREISRGGPSYTIQTVRQLKSLGWPQVSWLIGADMVAGLPSWHEAAALLAETRFVIMARPGSSMDWDRLPAPFAALKTQVVEVPQIQISATDIRKRVAAGKPIDFLTPPSVVQYIRDKSLYL